jgi:hypothetical protein
MLVSEPIKSYLASPLAMEEMSIEDIMREIPPEGLQYVGSVKDRVYMPVSFVQKWVLPTIRVQKALKESQDGKLPGGMKPAFLASIFDQSVMDFNKPVSKIPNRNHVTLITIIEKREKFLLANNVAILRASKEVLTSIIDIRIVASRMVVNHHPSIQTWAELLLRARIINPSASHHRKRDPL